MTQNEALNYLGISELSEVRDALEEELFLLRQQIISKGNIPQLLIARKKKLNQLNEVASILNIKKKSKYNQLLINKLESLNLIDCFNLFQKNKALILQKISSELNFENIEHCIDNLMLNLKMYCSLWPELNFENGEQVLLSKELDSMEMLHLLKELESKNICNFSDLTKHELPKPLIMEIKRLNALRKQFEA